jgi:aspartate/tyrosine/aromatic aminotransferase
MGMDLASLRSQWNEVLDLLESRDRIAWLVFFDARLASFDNNVLTLDFSDARKFASSHEYQAVRPKHKESLASAIKEVFLVDVEIAELA